MLPNPNSREVRRSEVVSYEQSSDPDNITPLARPVRQQTEHVTSTTGGIEQQQHVIVDNAGQEHREATSADRAAERRYKLYLTSQIIWIVFGIVEALIGIRVVLKLIGANPANEFAHFVYNASALFLAPFVGLTGTPAAGGMVLEVSSIIGMLVYALIAWALVKIVWLLGDRPMTRSATTYDRFHS